MVVIHRYRKGRNQLNYYYYVGSLELPSEKIFSDFSGFYFFRKIGKWGIGKIGKIGKCNAPQLSDSLANQRTWRQKNKKALYLK